MTPAKLRALVRAQVAETRARQGLDPTVTDPAFRAQLAAKVAHGLVRQKGGADEHDGGEAPTPRRRSRKQPTQRAATQGDADGSS